MLRRLLKIGHSRAARLIDTMERDGIVGPFKGSRPRDILITQAQLNERFRDDE
jgi:S-DNA-T family DNA segregation ATPase FtsK/SpoIIIE